MSSFHKLGLKSPCRLCADMCNPDVDNVFSNDNNFVELVLKYLSIKITIDDILPIQVCELCRLRLISFDEYAIKCATTQISLTSIAQESAEIELDERLLESVKSEYNTDIANFIKIETTGGSIKSEEDDCNFSENCYPISKSIRKSERKFRKIKGTASKRLRKCSLRKKKETRKSIFKLYDEENIEYELNSYEPTKKSQNFTINSSFLNFICHICHEEFLKWSALAKHTQQMHNTNPKVLCLCDKYLTCKSSVYKHFKKHDLRSLHKCTHCESTFLTESKYKKHLSTHSSNPEAIFKCDKCAKTFPKSYLLRAHEKNHTPREVRFTHPCDICGGKFASKCAVRAHVISVHDKEKSFVCDICGHAFATKGNLKAHVFLHTGERPHRCPHCPKSYKTMKSLRRHTDVHDGVTYKCTKCPSTFSYEKTLREHMHVHIDACRFVCGFCNKGFKWRRSFQCHLNLHTGKTPFSCPWCPKTFADGSNCRIHKRRKHPVELAEYEARNGVANTSQIKQISSTDKKVIRSIRFEDAIKPRIIPELDFVKSDSETE